MFDDSSLHRVALLPVLVSHHRCLWRNWHNQSSTDESSQKRKLKCDKTQPCSTCRARGEGERCQYDEGSTPPPQQSFVTVEQFQEQFRTLQAEVENLRRKLGDPPPRSASLGRRNPVSAMPSPISLDNHISPATLSDAGPAQDQSQAAHTHCPAVDVEHAFKQLDTLVEATSGADAICLSSDRFRSSEPITNAPTFGYGGLNLLGDSSAVGTRSAPAWPTIFLAAQTDRTDRWRRDMFEITSLLPSNELMSIMLEFFFKSLWTTPSEYISSPSASTADRQCNILTKQHSGKRYSNSKN